MLKRPVVWIALGLLSVALALAAYRGFPLAFSLVSVDISMDRNHALAAAREIAAADHLGPADAREAASFSLDEETQTFVELEGGGKTAFTAMLRDRLYLAYTWRVRLFREGEVNEATIAFAPDGRPYGFVEKIKEDAPGAALDTAAAQRIAERDAASGWGVDLSPYHLLEHGQTRRPAGRVDHTFTYERAAPTLNEGRYRLRLVVSGDRLTEVAPFVKVPEGFVRRYDSMRSANTTLGLVSVIGMVVLYGLGGMGVGLFVMLRLRWVVWRPAALWGIGISLVQTLVAVNEWPLVWMDYNTAVTRTLFFTEQLMGLAASFVAFSLIYTVSFMTAETLTRRAFGSHPQFWRVWSRPVGASVEVLGRTVAGYLLVTAFFAYDVGLYVVATHRLGWWSPSEALFHPDVLAAYMPWFSAIANSLQAGFWEECLFRAVPIAGAALIGDRLGYRRSAIVVAFVVQAIVFGSGHAPYPNQPFFARPVELILPSIGFGLLYLYFGLVPGIILHFTFDTTWFALPLFVAHAPGIWIQRVMVVAVVLVPLWVVLWRRTQVGRWTRIGDADRNAAWTPSAEAPRVVPPAQPVVATRGITTGIERVWLALGAAGLAACVLAAAVHGPIAKLPISRAQALDVARQALAERGASLGPTWRFLPMPDDGSGGPQEFVSETAGEARRRALAGSFLGTPRWYVRVATFEGDVALRAEEWHVFVTADGQARQIVHELPEARPGAALDEASARRRAHQAIADRLHLDAARGDVKEISATPNKLQARTDWTFIFV
ncbi:MAG TPA: type II CAAX endopeptidase family protein, partial [Vicinamibacterales bacterium]